jgi:ABC-type polysaccharide/polyol phosphate export permease
MTETRAIHPTEASGLRRELSDGLLVTWRNLRRIPRIPELATFAILQSIMFVLLFAFVFGGAIPLPGGGSYKEFLMPVLFGRTLSDVVYNAGILVVLMITGLFVEWSVRTGVVEFLAGVGLMLLFTFAMSWIGVWIGLSVPTVEVAQQFGFTVLFPLTFLSNAFVPTQTLPGILRPIAEWNPVSALTAATRKLWGNPNPYAAEGFPAENPELLTILWVGVMLAVFVPLAIRKYRSISR